MTTDKDYFWGYYVMVDAKKLAKEEGKDPDKLTWAQLQEYMDRIIEQQKDEETM